jgi:uncharacterized protein YdhG (YjbR/CyaY superfamily)
MPKPASVQDYLAGLPDDRRAVLEQLRQTVRAAAPDAEETIAYDMPALRIDGRFLVSYAAYKAHYSLFPANEVVVEACGEDLRPYLAGQGTIRFPANRPVPFDLVTRVVKARVAEVAGRSRS